MKVFQRTAIAFFSCLVLVACKREEYSQDTVTLKANTDTVQTIEMLPFKANLSSTPNIDSEYISCVFPDSFTFATVPKFSTMTGNTSHFGKLDKRKCALTVRDCSFDIETQTVEIVMDMTFRNKNGEGLKFLGAVNMSLEGPTSGVFEVIEGYGKFNGFNGWIATEGFINTALGTIFLSVDGMITQPNNRFRSYFVRNEQ
jgi:hypothetical protein